MRPTALFSILITFFFTLTISANAENLIQTWEVDLNGDGVCETVEVEWVEETSEYMRSFFTADFYYEGGYTVRINDLEVSGWLDSPDTARLIDIDNCDGKSELMLNAYGPSDDPNCIIFGYNGKEIYTVGEFYGRREFDNEGDVTALVWQGFWSAKFLWHLNSISHQLEQIEQPLYYVNECCNYIGDNCEYSATERFTLYSEPDGDVVVDNIEVGDNVTLIAANPQIYEEFDYSWMNFRWYLLKTDEGILGWALDTDFLWSLDGLCQAD